MRQVVILLALAGIALAYPQTSKTPKPAAPLPAYAPTPAPTPSGAKAPAAASPTPSGPVNPFNLTFVISGRSLPNKKKNNKPDPYVKVFHRTGQLQTQGDWKLIGQTDQIDDSDNPDFNNVFSFVWTKGLNQMWHFEVKDHDSYSKDDPIGQADVKIDDYVLQNNQDLTVKLNDGGSLVIKKVMPISFRLYARNVPKMDAFSGLSDPFVQCYWRKGKDGNDTLFYTTATLDDTENPDWSESIEFANYQKGTDQYLHFKVQDKDSVSGNDFIGETLVELDPFVQKRAAKINKLSTDAANKATLTITPA